jgi:hypothetical protein
VFRNIIVGSTPEAMLLRANRRGFNTLNINLIFSNKSKETLFSFPSVYQILYLAFTYLSYHPIIHSIYVMRALHIK